MTAYTYRADNSHLAGLPARLREVAVRLQARGDDLRDALAAEPLDAGDKAALAEVWGGSGAGREFQ